MASKGYEVIRQALKEKRQIFGYYEGRQFGACPFQIGHTMGQEVVLVSQFEGKGGNGQQSSTGNIQATCMKIGDITSLESKAGQWYEANFRGGGRGGRVCVEKVDASANEP